MYIKLVFVNSPFLDGTKSYCLCSDSCKRWQMIRIKTFIMIAFVFMALMLMSFVDPFSENTYSGTLSGSGLYNGYQITYYVNDSTHLVLSENGSLVSSDRYTISGRGKINNYEFPIRWDSDSGFQMFDNNTWISYDLFPVTVPAHFPFPVWIGYLGFMLLFLLLVIFTLRVFNV